MAGVSEGQEQPRIRREAKEESHKPKSYLGPPSRYIYTRYQEDAFSHRSRDDVSAWLARVVGFSSPMKALTIELKRPHSAHACRSPAVQIVTIVVGRAFLAWFARGEGVG